MAVYIDDKSQTLIIPDGSVERFITLPSYSGADGWFNSGVDLAGISFLKPGYLVIRPDAVHHVLLFCTAGELHYDCKATRGSIGAGDKLFIPAGYCQEYHCGVDTSMFWFHLLPGHSRWSYLADLKPMAGRSIYADECENVLEKIYLEGQAMPHRSDKIPQAYCQLALALLDGEFESDIADEEIIMQSRMRKVVRMVGMNLRKTWTVSQLARLAGMSVSHFHVVFVRCYGKSPMAMIQEMRMEQAKSMLHTGSTLDVIGEMLGYGSPFSFSRAFKSCTGMSPQEYRRKCGGGEGRA